jgi:hypothetical protein
MLLVSNNVQQRSTPTHPETANQDQLQPWATMIDAHMKDRGQVGVPVLRSQDSLLAGIKHRSISSEQVEALRTSKQKGRRSSR